MSARYPGYRYDEARELFWIGSNANEPATMGTLEASGGAFNMNTYVGHTFGWKVAGGPEQCVADDMEDRVTVLEGMKRHVLGEEPQITDEAKAKLESERDDPFSCAFTNDSPRRMTLTDTADPARTTSLPSKASVQWDVKRGGLFDWTDGDELLHVRRRGFFSDESRHRRGVRRGYSVETNVDIPRRRGRGAAARGWVAAMPRLAT